LSTLTKLCVVILAVLVLLACAVFTSQAVVPVKWRDAYNGEKLRRMRSDQVAANSQLALRLTTAQRDEALAEARRVKDESRQTKEQFQLQLDRAREKAASLEGDIKKITAKLSLLEENYRQNLDLRIQSEKNLANLRLDNDKVTAENLRLSDLLKTAQGEIESLQGLARFLREQKAEKDQRIEELEGQLAAAGKTPADVGGAVQSPASSRKITGVITTVKDDIAGINIGSANGIRQDMKLVIYRGAKLVGYLRIKRVHVDNAAGIIVDRLLDPMQGDKVSTSLLE